MEEENIKIEELNQIDENDFSEDDYDSESGILTSVKYDDPDNADKFIDSKDGSVIDKENLTPFQIIKTIAKQNNQSIKDPEKSCKHCYGRGFEGKDKDTQMPIPCRCLFRGKSNKEKEADQMYDSARLNGKMNHDQQRRMKLALYKQFKIQRKKLNKPKTIVEELNVDQKTERCIKVIDTYISLNSIKKTAKQMFLTITETKKILNENKEILEKMKLKD